MGTALSVERTKDWELIKSIVTQPAIYRQVTDDYSPKPEDWQAIQHEDVWYVLVSCAVPIGLFIFFPRNRICWEVHTCLLPEGYGTDAGIAVREWIFETTCCVRIIAEIPEYNRHARRFAVKCGMMEYGRNPKAYMKDGRLWDTLLMGISKCQ